MEKLIKCGKNICYALQNYAEKAKYKVENCTKKAMIKVFKINEHQFKILQNQLFLTRVMATI